jgi:hypothetical protein
MNALAFNQDRCCHLVLCLWLIPFHSHNKKVNCTENSVELLFGEGRLWSFFLLNFLVSIFVKTFFFLFITDISC